MDLFPGFCCQYSLDPSGLIPVSPSLVQTPFRSPTVTIINRDCWFWTFSCNVGCAVYTQFNLIQCTFIQHLKISASNTNRKHQMNRPIRLGVISLEMRAAGNVLPLKTPLIPYYRSLCHHWFMKTL